MTTNEQKCPVCECDTCIETGFNNQSLPICQRCGLPYILWEPIQSRIDKAVIAERERVIERVKTIIYDADMYNDDLKNGLIERIDNIT